MKTVDIEKANLVIKNNKISEELKECEEKLVILEENYEKVKNQNVGDGGENNVIILEELSQLKLTNKKNGEIIFNLNNDLKKYSDYEEIKEKYENINQQFENLKKDMQNRETQGGDTNKIIQELKEKMEIYELEAEIACNEPILGNEEDLKKNYKLIQAAFGKIQFDIDDQREEYELLLNEMNEEIAFIKNKYKDSMDKNQIDEIFLKKNEEIKNLKKIIHEYSDLNKNSEKLRDVNLKKDEEIENLKKEILKQKEEITTLEEIKQLLDDINLDLETNIENDNENINILNKELEDSKKEIDNFKIEINKYQEKLKELKENHNLQFGASIINLGGEDKGNTLGYQKNAASKQNEIREILFLKNTRSENLFDYLQFNFYLDSLPSEMRNSLHLEKFEKFKKLCKINSKIDLIIENVSINYIMNETIKFENKNIFGVANDLVLVLLTYQNYLNILRTKYLNDEEQDLSILENSVLNNQICKHYEKIEEIYFLIKSNDFSPQINFSLINETNLKLAREENFENYETDYNYYFKFLISKLVEKLLRRINEEDLDPKTKDLLMNLIPKIFFVSQQVFEIKIEQRLNLKFKTYLEDLRANLVDFKLWFESFYKKIDNHLMTNDELKQILLKGVWKENVNQLKTELNNFEIVKENLKSTETEKENLNKKIEDKNTEILKHKNTRLNLDSKILRLQTKVNNISTLELEITNLKKNEKRQDQELEKIKNEKTEIQSKMQDELRKIEEIQKKLSSQKVNVVRSQMRRASNLMSFFPGNTNQKNLEYNPRARFELNSINSIISHLLYQLNIYKNENCTNSLKKNKEKTPNFQKLIKKRFKNKLESKVVKESVSFLKKNTFLMKKELSKLEIVDLSEQNQGVKKYYKNKLLFNSFFSNSKNMLKESIREENEHVFNDDFCFGKELRREGGDRLRRIYGKLKFLEAGQGERKGDWEKMDLSVLIS